VLSPDGPVQKKPVLMMLGEDFHDPMTELGHSVTSALVQVMLQQ
jgi:hypothetical protein